MEIITEYKSLIILSTTLFIILLTLIVDWEMEDYEKFMEEKERKEDQAQNELMEKINNKNNDLKNYVNAVLKNHTNRIHYVNSVLIENKTDEASLAKLHRSFKDEDLQPIDFSEEKNIPVNQDRKKLSLREF